MGIRQDKFKVGDKVVWTGRYNTDHLLGNGPFTIKTIKNLDENEDEKGLLYAIGHTQHVTIEEDNDDDSVWSGAYFKLMEET